jgi:hypothetical protein
MKPKPIIKSIIILLVGLYLYSVGKSPLDHYIIHSVHLIFHEAGHFIFMFFGSQFIHMAGGTLLQLIIPIVLALYFLFVKKDVYASCFMLLWLGSSFFDVAIYAKDAIVMNLDLLGGDNVTHDWNYLLSTLGALKYTSQIASTIFSLGTMSLIVGVVVGIYGSFVLTTQEKPL